jgi:flap endonuclease-1
MGIKHLNRFLREYCPNSIKQIHLNQLRGQKIAIDTSIYLYRFIGENALIENMYLMITLFRNYDIKPIFIFDGKPPVEKTHILKERKEKKIRAEEEYNKLNKLLADANEEDKADIQINLDSLKKKFIRIRPSDIESVKELMQACGVTYLDAPGEADELCAKFVVKKKVYACMSEDMDMFVYGCNRVLRYLSLVNTNVIMYDYKNILCELNLTTKEFREICVVSGTDYNAHNNKRTSLPKTLKYFHKFKKDKETNKDFYEWLEEHTKYIDDICSLYSVYFMFDLSNVEYMKQYNSFPIINGPINQPLLRNILTNDGFIFLD